MDERRVPLNMIGYDDGEDADDTQLPQPDSA
jgi:hypothetical protein